MSDGLVYVMTGAVVISAIALVLQLAMLYGIARAAKAAQRQMEALAPRVETALESAQQAIDQSRKQVSEVTNRAGEVLDLTRKQLVRLDEVMVDATSRAKVQIERVELVLDDTIGRVHETVTTLNNGILRPLREVNALAAGIRAAAGVLLRGGRPDVSQATHDDEMFI